MHINRVIFENHIVVMSHLAANIIDIKHNNFITLLHTYYNKT